MGNHMSREVKLTLKRAKRKQHQKHDMPPPSSCSASETTSDHAMKKASETSGSSSSSKRFAASKTTVISGREFHGSDSATYWLPKDPDEQDRVIGQHFAIKEVYDGQNFLSEVGKYVPFNDGARICHVGCSAGAWMMDMAMEYPKCRFDGVDIVEVSKSDVMSDRISFHYGDITEQLDFPDNTFDFVFMRLFVLALREEEWEHAIQEAVRITKPGGVIQCLEYYFTPNFDDHPVVGKAANGIIDTMGSLGQDPYIGPKQPRLLTESGCNVIQIDNRPVDMSKDTPAAKKFLWVWYRVLKSMLPVMGPNIGVTAPADQERFINECVEGLKHCRTFYYMYSCAAQKL
ncbi:S-adenosyl-L-methionine-dependent methyltransferase [Fennellomyces sp. T-0311]|nr:S-adenosyl-L-methionine-dependent methyltransferase [Fennellomyces sp. T-0311]